MATRNENPIPVRAVHPGEVLREELKERGVSQRAFAAAAGVAASRLCEVINGKRALNTTLAAKLEALLGIPCASWLGLQSDYERDTAAIAARNAANVRAANVRAASVSVPHGGIGRMSAAGIATV